MLTLFRVCYGVLITGLFVFVVWLFTGWAWLEMAGLLICLLTFFLFCSMPVFGCWLLLLWIRDRLGWVQLIKAFCACSLMIVPFVVAANIVDEAIALDGVCWVIVENQSSTPVEHLVIQCGGGHYRVGELSPGGTKRLDVDGQIWGALFLQGEWSEIRLSRELAFRPLFWWRVVRVIVGVNGDVELRAVMW
ncbi:MAG: hypothetical protein RIG82_02445 [Phycisphaeraceae bacterium]